MFAQYFRLLGHQDDDDTAEKPLVQYIFLQGEGSAEVCYSGRSWCTHQVKGRDKSELAIAFCSS